MSISMRLIAISSSGAPAENVSLPESAEEVCQAMAALYQTSGFSPPWIGYLGWKEGVVVGTCAFKSAPRGGEVEIAYFTFPEHEGRGIATEMARSLVAMAHEADPKLAVTAQTLPEENASTAILRKLDFELLGTVRHPEDGPVWQWRLDAV